MLKVNIKSTLDNQILNNNNSNPFIRTLINFIATCFVEIDDTELKQKQNSISTKVSRILRRLKKIENFLDEFNFEGLPQKLEQLEWQLSSAKNGLYRLINDLSVEINNIKKVKPLNLNIQINNLPPQLIENQHYQFPTLLKMLCARLNVYLVGPAGSGKTYAAQACAKALNIPFYFTGAIASEFKLTGFIDAHGRIVSTEFRKAYEEGGLFLFDEIDASFPQAVLAFNAALANDYMDFPDKRVQRHPNFYCIAAANTYGQGADRQYIGRNQLDAASLDRFAFLEWKYDENLERILTGNDEWCSYVQKIRRCIEENKIRHLVTPRASINGARLIAQGLPREVVEQSVIWKGIDETTKEKIIMEIRDEIPFFADYSGTLTIPNGYYFSSTYPRTVKKNDLIATITYIDHKGLTKYHDIFAPCDGKVTYLRSPNLLVQKGEQIAILKKKQPSS
ncbi:MAG: AAA family ATPase [Bacteroidia bacterium]|nr:AAA family ATPase [Bacteroidia bacterium]MDW8157868.1 AAA family ATPase [Bacteroidia bacterium]